MSSDTATSNVAPRFFFNSAASQWAVTHIAGFTTRSQLSLGLHLLGLVAISKSEHRTLSLSSEARSLGHKDRFAFQVKTALVAAQLLVEHKRPGFKSTYQLGPAAESDRYRFLLQQHEQLAKQRQLSWPFNSKTDQMVDQSERSTPSIPSDTPAPQGHHHPCPPEAGVPLPPRGTTPLPPRGTTLKTMESTNQDFKSKAATQQPSAEVIPQAFGPAEISEQPEELEGPCRPETSNGVERVGEQPTASHCAQGSALFAQSTNNSVDDEINSDESEWTVLTVDEIDNVEPDSPGVFPSSNSLHCMVEHMDGRLGYFSIVSTDEVWIQRVEVAKTGRIVETSETSCLYRQQENGWNGWSLLLSNGETITFAQLRELDRAEQLNTVAS